MREFIKKGLGAIGAFCTLGSAMFWHLSADANSASLSLSGEAAKVFIDVATKENLYAAYFAVVAGLALSIATILD